MSEQQTQAKATGPSPAPDMQAGALAVKTKFAKRSDILTAFLFDNLDEVGELVRSLYPGSIVEIKSDSVRISCEGKHWSVSPGNVIMIDSEGFVRYVCRSHEEFKKEYCNITDVIAKKGPRSTDAVPKPYVGDPPRTMMDPKALLSLLELAYKELHSQKENPVTSDLSLAFPKNHCIIIV